MARVLLASLFFISAAHAELLALELSGPAVPAARVEHVIERSQGALVARVGRYLPEGFGRREAVGLLTDDELAALVEQLSALGAFTLPSVKRRDAQATYRVRLEVGGRKHSFEVSDPHRRPDGRHRAVIDLLRAAVETRTGTLPADDPLLPEEAGTLRVLTDVPARIRLDGALLEHTTPLLGLRVPAGARVLELSPLDGEVWHRYEIKVDVGRTTSLKVQLK